jgi:WD40 repeat protein
VRQYHAGIGPVLEVRFTPDGQTLVCVERLKDESDAKVVRWLSADTGKETSSLDLPFDVEETGDVFLSPDGRWVAVQHYLGDAVLLSLWDGRGQRWRTVDPKGTNCCIDAAVFSPGSDLLVFASGTDGGGTNCLERLCPGTEERLSPIDFPGFNVRYLAFSPDERRLAAVTFGGAFLYAHDRGRVEAKVPKLKLEVHEWGPIAFSPDGKELAILDGDEVLFWDGRTSEAETISFPGAEPLSLSYSPDGRFLALGCADRTVRFWERQARREGRRFDWGLGRVSSVAFAPDGMTCAAGGESGQVIVWDVSD